jgi:folate-dependent phosphoribosylglycinamide formyltransferase PurN
MRMLSTLALAAALLVPTAAIAERKLSHAELRAKGCTVHHVRVPAGKIVHQTPTVRCPAGAMETLTKKKVLEARANDAALVN